MAYRSYLRSVLNDNFKILTWLLILFIAITPNFIFMQSARAAVGGWNLSNPVAQGASTIYDATKNVVINGKDFVKDSWVKITPNASQVAKVLARGAAGYALSVAVEQLIGAVDWVLDPANNQIKYTDPALPPDNPKLVWIWAGCSSYQACTVSGIIASTPTAACQKWADSRTPKLSVKKHSYYFYKTKSDVFFPDNITTRC